MGKSVDVNWHKKIALTRLHENIVSNKWLRTSLDWAEFRPAKCHRCKSDSVAPPQQEEWTKEEEEVEEEDEEEKKAVVIWRYTNWLLSGLLCLTQTLWEPIKYIVWFQL